jgi:hypothetical protein
MGRRKVKKQNIVRETDTERRAKQQAQSDLAFAQQLRGSRDELIEKLTSQELLPLIKLLAKPKLVLEGMMPLLT